DLDLHLELCVLAPQLLKIFSGRSIRLGDPGHRLLLKLETPRSQLADAYAQLSRQLSLGLLAHRRLTNRFKLEFPRQFAARCGLHRTPPQSVLLQLRCPSNVGTFNTARSCPSRGTPKLAES